MSELDICHRFLFAVCIPKRCEHLDKGAHKNYCCKEDYLGKCPSKELMLKCALVFNLDTAEELNRFRIKEKNKKQ